jgi:poly [ADP-ribose] polymerase 6/8
MYESQAEHPNSIRVHFSLPSEFLPWMTRVIYAFEDPVLLNVILELDHYEWRAYPLFLEISHPSDSSNYLGAALVETATRAFFSPSFRPARRYRSEVFLLPPPSGAPVSPRDVRTLESEGWDERWAKNALALFSGSLSEAREFLVARTVGPSAVERALPDYSSCPLLYFALELAECFIDLTDHCSLCRAPTVAGIKPTVCGAKRCTFQSTEIGVGTNVHREMKADPQVADLVLSLFSCALPTEFLNPAPPDFTKEQATAIMQKLPSVASMVADAADDRGLVQRIGIRAFQLVRWVLFSNRSHLVSLPSDLQLPNFGNAKQFLTVISSPEAEGRFNIIKRQFGSMFLWHGSGSDRWHAILRAGLKNATGTRLMAWGPAHGEGIYFAPESNTSFGYIKTGANGYPASALGANLRLIALCEVAKIGTDTTVQLPKPTPEGQIKTVPVRGFLKDHGWAFTLSLEEACVVRMLFLCAGAEAFNVNIVKDPPRGLPAPKTIMERRMTRH